MKLSLGENVALTKISFFCSSNKLIFHNFFCLNCFMDCRAMRYLSKTLIFMTEKCKLSKLICIFKAEPGKAKLSWDVHFWLGAETTVVGHYLNNILKNIQIYISSKFLGNE